MIVTGTDESTRSFFGCVDSHLQGHAGVRSESAYTPGFFSAPANTKFSWSCNALALSMEDEAALILAAKIDFWKRFVGAYPQIDMSGPSNTFTQVTRIFDETQARRVVQLSGTPIERCSFHVFGDNVITYHFASGKRHSAAAIEYLSSQLSGVGVPKVTIKMVLTAFSEALINVPAHAYGGITNQPVADATGAVTIGDLRRWWLLLRTDAVAGEAKLIICDRGDGLLSDIRRSNYVANLGQHQNANDSQILHALIALGGVPRLTNPLGHARGRGFGDILLPAKRGAARLRIFSGAASANCYLGQISVANHKHKLPGTIVSWEVRR